MLEITIGIFLVAALGGLVMAKQIFDGRTPAVAIALLHGPLAACGLFLVFYLWMKTQADTMIGTALGVLFLAALGGFLLVSFHLRNKPHPKAAVIAHAAVAVTGVAILVFAALR
ncbi:MAG TPA: hypothetical protein VKZ99_09020 [Gammaproteobacteria bacterium]|nr:hypothetical protein [Gammaproteobacteria bacterium]